MKFLSIKMQMRLLKLNVQQE